MTQRIVTQIRKEKVKFDNLQISDNNVFGLPQGCSGPVRSGPVVRMPRLRTSVRSGCWRFPGCGFRSCLVVSFTSPVRSGSVDRTADRSVDRTVDRSVDRTVDQPIGRPVGREFEGANPLIIPWIPGCTRK